MTVVEKHQQKIEQQERKIQERLYQRQKTHTVRIFPKFSA
jgi:hypothetical protein